MSNATEATVTAAPVVDTMATEGFAFSRADSRVKAAVRSAWNATDAAGREALRVSFVRGFVAGRIAKGSKLTASMLADAARIMALPDAVPASLPAEKQAAMLEKIPAAGRKNTDEQAAVQAARTAWHRLTAEPKAKPGAGRTAEPDAKAAPQSETTKEAPTAAPTDASAKYATVGEGVAYLRQQASTMLAMLDKYPTAFNSPLRKLVKDFADDINGYTVPE